MGQLRLAVICDYPEEDWPSMDLCAQMLLKHLQSEQAEFLNSISICPTFKKRFQHIPRLGEKRVALNGDRVLNRFYYYPQYLGQRVSDFDLFHVSDHTYAQLLHVLPPDKTGVFCHDIDAFRSLVEPEQEPRPGWYQAMSRRILQGLQKAAIVFYSTAEVRKQIEQYGLLDPSRLVHSPYGISPEFFIPGSDGVSAPIPSKISQTPFILHVGSCISRKRIDVLLEVFAALQAKHPDLQLIKVSGDWTESQQEQIAQLGINNSIIHLKGLERTTIAELYRRAAVVLLTSEAEGFGLPVIEALACGAIIVASDIPVLREVGGSAAVYCPVGDVSAWVKTLEQLLIEPSAAPELNLRLVQAQKYSWSAHAQTIAQAYLQLTG